MALYLNKHHPVLALRRVGVGITFFKDAFPDVDLNRLRSCEMLPV